ncbi:MAG: hypothetical protein HZA90_26545 [Verrucomicrobia bacterium]|nr:hypothetical protein [Verrucomicrobiota bacterium]
MTPISDRVVSPKDCLLLVGLPLGRENFFRSFDDPLTYAALSRNQHLKDEALWVGYSGLADSALKFCDKVTSFGGRAQTSPAVRDLAELSRDYAVIAFWTHATWPPLGANDIRDVPGLWTTLHSGEDAVSKAFRAWCQEAGIPLNSLSEDDAKRAWLAEAVGRANVFAHAEAAAFPPERKPRGGNPICRRTSECAENLHRPAFDRQFSEFITESRGIELDGQMRSVGEVFSEFSQDQPRVFDLRMCNSSMIAGSVKQRCPASLVVVNQWQADPLVGLLRYVLVLQELARAPISYVEACRRVHIAGLALRKSL